MPINEHFELLTAVEPTVERLLAEHRARRVHWYFHDMIPWELGRNFKNGPRGMNRNARSTNGLGRRWCSTS